MAEAQHSHRHPDYDQRIRALQEQIKKMQKEIQDLRHKLETHDHPHTLRGPSSEKSSFGVGQFGDEYRPTTK